MAELSTHFLPKNKKVERNVDMRDSSSNDIHDTLDPPHSPFFWTKLVAQSLFIARVYVIVKRLDRKDLLMSTCNSECAWTAVCAEFVAFVVDGQ